MKNFTLTLLFFISANLVAQVPQTIFPTSGYNGTYFGRDVKISNNEILISSANAPTEIGGSGKVFLFNLANNLLNQTAFFYPTDALVTDNFGSSIAIENNLIAIGSPYHDSNFQNSGAVYVYKKTNGIWELLQKITANDAALDDHFGSFVSIHNNQILISATNDGNGSVYVYDFNESTYSFSEKITIANSWKFGSKIEIENNKMVILSNILDSNAVFFATYTFNGTNWIIQNATLPLGSLEENIKDFSLSNNRLYLISSSIFNNGKINIYDDIDNIWSFTSATNVNIFPDQVFTKIEVFANTMLLGSTEYILQTERKFPVLIYKNINNNWTYQNYVYGFGETNNDDHFGACLALSENLAVVGAPQEGVAYNAGQAYYFDTFLDRKSFEKSSLYLYPNPISDILNIKNDSELTIDGVNLYSVNGNLLLSQKSSLEQLSLTNFPTGMYFLKVHFSNNTETTYKVLKK